MYAPTQMSVLRREKCLDCSITPETYVFRPFP